MSTVTLNAKMRELRGKGPARRLRAEGNVPAIFYGSKMSPLAITVNAREFRKSIEKGGSNALFDMTIESDGDSINKMAILKDKHIRPMDAAIIHLDFYEIFMDQEIQVTVPVELTGKPVGVEQGGVLQTGVREVLVSCLPRQVPDSLVADVSNLDIADTLHVSDLELPEGVTLLADESVSIVTVLSPLRVEEEEPEEGEEGETAEGEKEQASEDEQSE